MILYGDCRSLISQITDSTVDLVLTDPPYSKEYNWCFDFLYKESSRILKPGGSLVFLLGHTQLEAAIKSCYYDLRYWWVGSLANNRNQRIFGKNVIAAHKPVLWFLKGKRGGKTGKVPVDALRFDSESWKKSKTNHKWGQPIGFAKEWISTLTKEGDIVLDPFCATGCFCTAAKELNRVGIGFEIKPEPTKEGE